MERKLFSPVRVLRLLFVSVLYIGASIHASENIEILDNTTYSLIVTAGLDFVSFLCWFIFTIFALWHFFDWIDRPTQKERDEQIDAIENALRKHFPSLDKQAKDENK